MAIPLILAIGGRVAFTVIARAIAANRARAIAKYGKKAVTEAIKIAKTTKSSDKAVINAAKKIVKNPKFTAKVKPKKVTPKPKPKKVTPRSKPKPIVKAKPKVTPKSKPKKIVSRSKPKPVVKAKPKVTPKSKPKKIVSRSKPKAKDTVKTKPTIKVIKGKPTTVTSKVKQKLKPRVKPTTKPKVRPKSKPKPVTPKPKPKPIVKGKLTKALPAVVGGGLRLGGLIASMKGKDKSKDTNIKIERKDKPPLPAKFAKGTGRGDGQAETITRRKDAEIAKMKEKASRDQRKLYNNKVDTYESRVRAMVAKKDQLQNVDAGDGSGRNKYQVEMNKLKKERPKEFRKLFKFGFGKLKD